MAEQTPPPALTTRDQVKAWLAIPDNRDDELIDQVVDAVNAWIAEVKGAPAGGVWSANYIQAATMLSARVYRRRNSVNGVEQFDGDLGTAIYTISRDHDVAQLLMIGGYRKPKVG